ncbi:MAG: hypothetical protein ACTSRG_10180 [Candidatus Helarchaeota archaeon]
MGKATKRAFKALKYIILFYGLAVSGLSFMVGMDASQLTFPPQTFPHPLLLEYMNTGDSSYLNRYFTRDPQEYVFIMGNNGFLYKFVVPTVIIIHNGTFGKDTRYFVPEIYNLTGGALFPMILPPKSSLWFTIHTPNNYTNPIFQFIVLPQVWLGGFKIMSFQINTYTIPFGNFSSLI